MKQEFELSSEDLAFILNACRPVPAMYLSGGQLMGASPQENANAAWQTIADKLGFIWDTVEPSRGKSQNFIMAEPTT